MSAIAVGTVVPELLPEHADGTIWADIEGDLWTPSMFGWATIRRRPFIINTELGVKPGVSFGPYVAVLGPSEPKDADDGQ